MIQQIEYANRRRRAGARLPEWKLESLLITGLANIRYLTGFTGSNGLVLLTPEAATLYTDPRYTIQAGEETDCGVKIVAKGSLVAAAAHQISRAKLKRIGFEKNRLSYSGYSELQQFLKLGETLEPVASPIEQQRMIKSEAEIELIRRSVLTNSKAFDQAIRKIKPSTTESKLAAELEYQMRRFGAEKPAFETIVAAGARTALPHAQPKPVAIGDRLLLVDMGAMQDGYCSDMTRMLHVGQPHGRARKLFRAVLEAQLAAVDVVRANVTAGSVDGAARKVLKAHGLDKAFVHSTGHGLGLEIHEPPRLGRSDNTVLRAGMVITIEPGAYLEGLGGVRIEDTVLVTSRGCEVLTSTEKILFIV
ncbi:MAG TPA: Xaa-Pro peptidase family protein [Bryobacteraceae bacterium]|nr:Xaa-Pro peptidase family protein [Bryobacteraceae bacterium]